MCSAPWKKFKAYKGNPMGHQIEAEEAARIQEQEKAMMDDIASRLTAFGKERGNLIPILQMIQNRHAYLAPESIGLVADHLGIERFAYRRWAEVIQVALCRR